MDDEKKESTKPEERRSGLSSTSTRVELGHMTDILARPLLAGALRKRNLLYLTLLVILGALCISPFLLALLSRK